MIARARFSAVIFDMDGLMLDTEPISHRAWAQATNARGVSLPAEVLDRMIGRNERDCEHLLRGTLGSAAAAAELMEAWRSCYDVELARGIPTKPGLVELLDWLEAESIAKAVATSSYRYRATSKLATTGLLGRFSAVVAGDEVDRGKPAPDIFAAAATRLRAAPEQCLVLEDSEPGIRAALAAGMTAVMVPDLQPASPALIALGVHVASTLYEVQDWLVAGERQRSSVSDARAVR